MREIRTSLRCAVATLLCFPLIGVVRGQDAAPANAAEIERAVIQALSGEWSGYLEYRDYSEPATSTKRVQLPTWLTVSGSASPITMRYLYDDGPSKVVEEVEQVTIDAAKAAYRIRSGSGSETSYRIEGLASLRAGLGALTLTGAGTDNNKPAERRITLTIKRNLVQLLLETRPAGSGEAFAFRHMYRFTRSRPPASRQ